MIDLRLNKIVLEDYSFILGSFGLINYGSIDDLTNMPIVALTDFLQYVDPNSHAQKSIDEWEQIFTKSWEEVSKLSVEEVKAKSLEII